MPKRLTKEDKLMPMVISLHLRPYIRIRDQQ